MATGAGRRVLIVDDDATTLMLMCEALTGAGYSISKAHNGVEALELFSQSRPDLVLLDIEMPEMDGFAACRAMRQQTRNVRFPIAMVTGLDDAASIRRAFAAGATDFIRKPINWPLFQHRVAAILESSDVAAMLVSSQEHVHSLEQVNPDIAMLVARDGAILEHLGKRFAPNSASDLRPQQISDLWPDEISTAMLQRIRRVLKTRSNTSYEFELTADSGSRYYESRFLVDGRKQVLVIVQEVSSRTTSTEAFQLAYYDSETRLPNRHRLEKDTAARIADAKLREHRLALFCFEFDLLKQMKQSLGAPAKRGVLEAIAGRLNGLIETRRDQIEPSYASAEELAIVARTSSNKFAILDSAVRSKKDAAGLAEKLRQAFVEAPISGESLVRLKPIVGIAMFPEDGDDSATLIRSAEAAMYEARIGEDSGPRFYSDLGRSGHDRIDRAAELRWALEQNHLQMHYQPRLSFDSEEVVGVEALLRWEHPLRGFVPLDELIPLAEATGLITTIGEWVLRTACTEISSCREAGQSPLRVSINLSHQEFLREDLPGQLAAVMQETTFDAGYLELELTERTLMRSQNPVHSLNALAKLGVGFMLDNFGTGYSSLAALREYPVNALKIDKSFVERLSEHRKDAAICEVIVGTAHKLGLRAVAEGVETAEQADFLRRHGCDEMQGFLVSPPLPLTDLKAFLERREPNQRLA